MALGENIKRLRKARGWDQKTLSAASGVQIGTISAIEVRNSRKSGYATAIAAALGVTVETLESREATDAVLSTGEGRMMGGEATPSLAIELEGNPEYPSVRRVSVKAQAGITGYAVEHCEDVAPIVFRSDWYKSHGYRPERLMALRVAGESMVPSLWPGDLIVVNTESAEPKDGTAFLVVYEGEVAVKRLVRDAGAWWLASDNSDQRRYSRKLCDDATQIIGEVIYKQSERV